MLKSNAGRLFYLVRASDVDYYLYSVLNDKLILSKVPSYVALDFLRLNEPSNPAISFLEKGPAYDPDKDWEWWKKNVYEPNEKARSFAEKELNENMGPRNKDTESFVELTYNTSKEDFNTWTDKVCDSSEEFSSLLEVEDYLNLYSSGFKYSSDDPCKSYNPYDLNLNHNDFWDNLYSNTKNFLVTEDNSKQLELDFPVKGSNSNEVSARYKDTDNSYPKLIVVAGKTDSPKTQYDPDSEWKILNIDDD